MAVAEQDKGLKVPIWDTYSKILKQRHNGDVGIAYLERFEFYERAKRAVVIVQTGYVQYGIDQILNFTDIHSHSHSVLLLLLSEKLQNTAI